MRIQIAKAWEHLQEDSLAINLMLTEYCNFKCAHCMYSCSNRKSKDYMSYETLEAVRNIVEAWNAVPDSHGININLIGGEPTVDLEKFKTITRQLNRWENCSFEMTTNGSWLNTKETLEDFVEALKLLNQETYVRISSSEYHDPFRPLQIKNLLRDAKVFKAELECSFTQLYSLLVNCPECDKEVSPYEDCVCGYSSDDLLSEMDTQHTGLFDACNYLTGMISDECLYVDRQNSQRLASVGRAAANGLVCHTFNKDIAAPSCYSPSITFRPDGRMAGPCASGRVLDLGTVHDGLAVILAAQVYILWMNEQKDKMCLACSKEFKGKFGKTITKQCQEWLAKNLKLEESLWIKRN